MTQSHQGINRRRFVVTTATQVTVAAFAATAAAADGEPARDSADPGNSARSSAPRELARNADTLVIACVYVGRTKAYADIITGTAEVAEMAQACGVKRVVLSHAAPGFSKAAVKQRAVDDVARGYSGAVCFPDELTTVDL